MGVEDGARPVDACGPRADPEGKPRGLHHVQGMAQLLYGLEGQRFGRASLGQKRLLCEWRRKDGQRLLWSSAVLPCIPCRQPADDDDGGGGGGLQQAHGRVWADKIGFRYQRRSGMELPANKPHTATSARARNVE